MNAESLNHLSDMLQLRGVIPDIGMDLNRGMPTLPGDGIRQLHDFMRNCAELLPTLESELDARQEAFVVELGKHMERERLVPAERLHLSLAEDGNLVVEGEERDAEQLCAIISRTPSLKHNFKELAKLALLVHGLDIGRRAHETMCQPDGVLDPRLSSRYHMCMKGSLSHFYVR